MIIQISGRYMDDNERIRKAVMDVIHPEEVQNSSGSDEPRPETTVTESIPVSPAAEPVTDNKTLRTDPAVCSGAASRGAAIRGTAD